MNLFFKVALLLLLSLSFSSKAQVQGDITHDAFVSGFNHDPNICSSEFFIDHLITIDNSFVGDSVTVVFYGGATYSEENLTGNTIWNVVVPYTEFGFASDDMVVGGMLNIGWPTDIQKIISGTDTLYWLNDAMVFESVPNACDYNTVSGKVYIDNDMNCSFNTGDSVIVGLSVTSSADYTSNQSYNLLFGSNTNASGDYNINLQETWVNNYTVSIPSFYQFIFPNSTCTPASYSFNTMPQSGVDFVLECADVDTRVGGSAPLIHAALPFFFNPFVTNVGCDPVSGVLKLVLNQDVTYSSGLSTNPADYVIGDTLFWNYSGLNNITAGGYWNSVVGGIHLTPDVTVNTGDTLCFELITGVPSNDVNPLNNSAMICLPVVASYDPNFKEVFPKGNGPEGFIPASNSKLKYKIHFQNTGTAEAINVRVVDSLEQFVIPESLHIVSSSHSMSPEWLDQNVVRFNFNNIYLPDSTSNEPASHGFVEFEIEMQQGLSEGTEITNRAHIYFDNNAPITTGYALNTIDYLSSIGEIGHEDLLIYPNPTSGLIQVKSENNIELVQLLTLDGQLLLSTVSDSIDLSNYPAGVYFVKVSTTHSIQMEKVVKR
jgi:uncharacterized repeat protein (TIGR01451 family)